MSEYDEGLELSGRGELEIGSGGGSAALTAAYRKACNRKTDLDIDILLQGREDIS